jgi:hypothetical protein
MFIGNIFLERGEKGLEKGGSCVKGVCRKSVEWKWGVGKWNRGGEMGDIGQYCTQ